MTKLTAGDLLLVGGRPSDVYRVRSVTPEPPAARTVAVVEPWSEAPALVTPIAQVKTIVSKYLDIIKTKNLVDAPAAAIKQALTDLQTRINRSGSTADLEDAVQVAFRAADDQLRDLDSTNATPQEQVSPLLDELAQSVFSEPDRSGWHAAS